MQFKNLPLNNIEYSSCKGAKNMYAKNLCLGRKKGSNVLNGASLNSRSITNQINFRFIEDREKKNTHLFILLTYFIKDKIA